MFLLRLAKVDFSLIFNQGFRLLLVINTIICYSILLLCHALLMKPMHQICGHSQFSWITRWMLTAERENPLSKDSNGILVVCCTTNVTDMTMMSIGLLLVALFMCECCLHQRKKRHLEKLMKNRCSMLSKNEEGNKQLDAKILRQRLSKRSSTTRFITRLALLLPSSILAAIQLLCAIISFLLFHFVQQDLGMTDDVASEVNKAFASRVELVKWRLLIYLILSFFLAGFFWSMSGIDMSMLKAIYARSKRQDQFRRMNASVFTEGNTIEA